MSWETAGSIGEVIGAIVLIVTIVYMALQTRHAKQATIDQNILARAKSVQDQMLVIAENEELRMALIRNYGVVDFYEQLALEQGVTIEEASQVDWANAYWFWVHWGQWASTHSAKELRELENIIGAFYGVGGMRNTWNSSPWGKPILDPEFVSFVENVLSKHVEPNS
ncbi:hypothetical protein EYC98_19895 [Halieaceae bacterium IMCC14734]|uniref:DUF4760 domain-containing protein n=1 Tax=Candidatus Litorirhabdus singularis TaxID=2518993 RepID=A0ABT3TN23_9GAMM|nr:hypothetical protein [Candidatus Litorirhabdus singularis]MCX2983131.1 hypothetical protein [Candidatus Litorirhabdus singularis]